MATSARARRRDRPRGSPILRLLLAAPAAALVAAWGAVTFLPAPGTASPTARYYGGSRSASPRGDLIARPAKGEVSTTEKKKKVKRRRITEPQATKLPWEEGQKPNPDKEVVATGVGGLFNVVEFEAPEWYADNPYVRDYFKVDPETQPNVISHVYPGARDWVQIFWTLVQPTASLAFLIVAISIFQGRDIINDVPFLTQLFPVLKNLKRPEGAEWFPSGAFMGFYGFFGTFVFGPLQWFMAIKNPGEGVCEFNKDTGIIKLVRDDKEQKRMNIDNVKAVMMEYCPNFAGGRREVFLILNSKHPVTGKNDEFHFEVAPEELPKTKLEEKAKALADFLDCDLEQNIE